ncbi:MAG TPA: hypothetical protein PLU87_09035 [Sedimentisphaerales bacterium]|nr:hypothetical protein [Sedimentisphaerales bacterium]HRS11128.1 hypothetical protein [Sedimentisphaerales bacterium]HRV47663.1 hypothetical protein [Sedimentisphaerales bacterium]
MESHASRSPRQHGLGFGVLVGLIILVAAAGAPAESQIAELEPGPYSYQHAQLMADAYATSFGQRRPPYPAPAPMRAEEVESLCRHLDSLQEQLRQTEQKLAELNTATAPAPPETPPMAIARPHDVEAGIAELSQHREMLTQRANQRTMELRELREHVMNREREIASELRDIHEQLLNVEQELVGLDRQRQEDRERLMAAQNRAAELEERLRRLMAETDELRRQVTDQIEANHRREAAIRTEIEQTRQRAQQVRDQIEEIGRVPESMPGRWPMYAPPAPPAVPVPSPDPALQTELKLLREEVALLREQLRQAPARAEVVHVVNPYAVGSARYYSRPCR